MKKAPLGALFILVIDIECIFQFLCEVKNSVFEKKLSVVMCLFVLYYRVKLLMKVRYVCVSYTIGIVSGPKTFS